MTERDYWVYIIGAGPNAPLYVGVTSDLRRRAWLHRNKVLDGFTKSRDLGRLLYYERHTSIEFAIRREKRLKKWPRAWKIDLILGMNPQWLDLWEGLGS